MLSIASIINCASNRGAELINLLMTSRLARQEIKRKKEMAHIKSKLERIRLRTSRLEGGSRENWTHFNGMVCIKLLHCYFSK